MEKIDARTLTQEAQEALRRQIITLRSAGRANKLVAATVGVSEAHCSTVWSRYRKNGAEAVAKRKRGRRHGDKRSLTAEQEATIKRLLVDRFPRQLNLNCALWNRAAVQLLITQQCGFLMPTRTVGEYLRRWGVIPYKPVKGGINSENAHWLGNDYPALAKRARAEKREIYWCGEISIRVDAKAEKNTSLHGNTMEAPRTPETQRATMIYAVSNKGKVSFKFYREALNNNRRTGFMRRLVSDAGRKVFLILDNQKVRRSKLISKWLINRADKIEIFYQ